MTLVQVASLFVDAPSYYSLFFSLIEISTTLMIIGIALKWKEMDVSKEESYFRKMNLI